MNKIILIISVIFFAIIAYFLASKSFERASNHEDFLLEFINLIENNEAEIILDYFHPIYRSIDNKTKNLEILIEIKKNLQNIGGREKKGFTITSHRSASRPFSESHSDVFITHVKYQEGMVTFNIGVVKKGEQNYIDRFSVDSSLFDEKLQLSYLCSEEKGITNNCEELKEDKEIDLPLKNQEEYVKSVNEWLVEQHKLREKAKEKMQTPEYKKKEKEFYQRIIDSEHLRTRVINFYGKVVDQDGQAVPGVKVNFLADSTFLASGTGPGETFTDRQGEFRISDVRGAGLSIKSFSKLHYQFPEQIYFDNDKRFEDSVLWKDFTKENPYIFKAWKVERYPKVNTNVNGTTFSFNLNTIYSMDFTKSSPKKVKHKGSLDLDLQVIINHNNSSWEAKLLVPNGGLIETNDSYLNLAPETGYVKELSYSGVDKKKDWVKKKYYIYSRGKYYGSLIAEIRPLYRDISAIRFYYTINLEGGRNLVVKQN